VQFFVAARPTSLPIRHQAPGPQTPPPATAFTTPRYLVGTPDETPHPACKKEHNTTIMSSPKRRIETDVMKMLMSDYEVTLVNDNMQEFYVRFKGPEESKYTLTANHYPIMEA
jgi:hypothetical protein